MFTLLGNQLMHVAAQCNATADSFPESRCCLVEALKGPSPRSLESDEWGGSDRRHSLDGRQAYRSILRTHHEKQGFLLDTELTMRVKVGAGA